MKKQKKDVKRIVKDIVKQLMGKSSMKREKWITADKAMKMLGIKSKSTLQRYREDGRIKYAQPDKKIILYDVDSINDILGKH